MLPKQLSEALEELQFNLIYHGPLPAMQGDATRAKDKQAIRRFFRPQLETLWRTHPLLSHVGQNYLREGQLVQRYLKPIGANPFPSEENVNETSLFFRLGGYRFLPLVIRNLGLTASVAVDFFRQGRPGDLVIGGDLDNRLKVLLDALRMPHDVGELSGDTSAQPDELFHVVMEDDSLLTGLAVETNQLLAPILPGAKRSDVWLRLRVTIKPERVNLMNVGLV